MRLLLSGVERSSAHYVVGPTHIYPMQLLSQRFRFTLWGVALTCVAMLVAVFQIVAGGHCGRPGMLCWVCPLLLPLEWAARSSDIPAIGVVVLVGFFLHWPLIGLLVDRRCARLRLEGLGTRRP